MKIINKLLRKNLSAAQTAGFILSNFIGLSIIVAGLQFYLDLRSIWDSEDSFVRRDFIVVNKKIDASGLTGASELTFTREEISDLESQPWVRSCGNFTGVQYQVSASVVGNGGRGMSTDMFFESIPDEYIDVADGGWQYVPGKNEVPVIISKDYLTLYNMGFAGSAGLPQMSEQMMSAIPMRLRLRSEKGDKEMTLNGRIAGYSNRLNTILVPQTFMDYTNGLLGSGEKENPRRLIVDVSSPGDVAIGKYLDSRGWELAGDKSGSQASYLLNVGGGVIVGIGMVITLLSFFILMLSISLLMQKNREKLHALIMLGFPLRDVGAPYEGLIVLSTLAALIPAIVIMLLLRGFYMGRLAGIAGMASGGIWLSLTAGIVLAAIMTVVNIISVRKKVKESF
ncbi:MAG: ABC transporter permease [Muribaculaceae bacterium]|nr:ABC transporter permease [Muribaculaceae bacterium]